MHNRKERKNCAKDLTPFVFSRVPSDFYRTSLAFQSPVRELILVELCPATHIASHPGCNLGYLSVCYQYNIPDGIEPHIS
jgi:hypothetical protein